MASNLFDFGKTEFNEENKDVKFDKETLEKIESSNIDKDTAKNIYDKYKDYSKSDLLNELHKVVKKGKREGSITDKKIQETVNGLTPFLNENQRNFLNSILKDIND